MKVDLNAFTTASVDREVFNPTNGWQQEQRLARAYLTVGRGYNGLIWQIGFDADAPADYYVRFKRDGEPWGEWAVFHTSDAGGGEVPVEPEPEPEPEPGVRR